MFPLWTSESSFVSWGEFNPTTQSVQMPDCSALDKCDQASGVLDNSSPDLGMKERAYSPQNVSPLIWMEVRPP